MSRITGKLEKELYDLVGTSGICGSIDSVLEDHGLDFGSITQDEALEIDNILFTCGLCGWYCEASDANESPESAHEDICSQCYESLVEE